MRWQTVRTVLAKELRETVRDRRTLFMMLLLPTLLYPAILVFCGIGVFSLNNTEFDVYVMAVFGLVGYLFSKLECEPAPMLLGFILGPMMEEYLRRAMLLSRGDPLVLVQRPISAVILIVAAIAIVVVVTPSMRSKREEAFQEG